MKSLKVLLLCNYLQLLANNTKLPAVPHLGMILIDIYIAVP